MDITHLRYFLKTVEVMNYSRAAEELFTSRQALCHTLGNLERELGKELFRNERNHLSLTEYGEYLVHAVKELVADFDRTEADVTRFFQQSARLHVAFSVSLFPFHLPNIDPILQEFSAQHPHILLDIDRCTPDEVVDMVEDSAVDCGIVLQMPTPRANSSATVLRTSDVAIGSGPDSPLHGKESLTPEDLSAVPLVGMGSLEKIAKPLWDDCRKRGVTLNYQVFPNALDALYQIRNSLASGFNTFLNDPNRLPVSRPSVPKAVLLGYTWEIAALCPQNRPNFHAAQLFASFLQEKYCSEEYKPEPVEIH